MKKIIKIFNKKRKSQKGKRHDPILEDVVEAPHIQSGHILYENPNGTYNSYETVEFIKQVLNYCHHFNIHIIDCTILNV